MKHASSSFMLARLLFVAEFLDLELQPLSKAYHQTPHMLIVQMLAEPVCI